MPRRKNKLDLDQDEAAVIADFIHDLRTPLLTVKNLTSSLSDFPDVKKGIETQIDGINERRDAFWGEIKGEKVATEPKTSSQDRLSEINSSPPSAVNADTLSNILVVDDDEITREVSRLVLEEEGYQVITSANGYEAIMCCTSTEIDLVLTDINMPGLTGIDLADALIEKNNHSHRPCVVGMSNDPRIEETRAECLAAGMDGYIEKPFTIEKWMALTQ